MAPLAIAVDSEQLSERLRELAAISDCPEPPPAVTRVVFSEKDLKAREYLASLYRDAGLQVRTDAIGNTFARWVGSDPDLPAVGTGSHTDAIPHSGMYDGTVGVLGGLEAILSLQRAGFRPKRSIELVMFTSEEPTRFGVGCTGSRLMSGAMSTDQLCKLKDDAGDDYDQVRLRAGFEGPIDQARLPRDYYQAWVELHIEQGPELESSFLDIGVVTAIAAPATYAFEVKGVGGHAGAVLMPGRKDALCAAVKVVLAIEYLARKSVSPDLVATVGQLLVHPGAINSIPSHVRFTLDIRDIDSANRDDIVEQAIAWAGRIAKQREVVIEHQCLNSDPPAISSPLIIEAIESACDTVGVTRQSMISRAYHDSLFMARIAPTAMIFIPCKGGVSHRPDEYSTPEQIAKGVAVLAHTLAQLSMS
jgi:ureidoglycolate amidohydrolase